MKMPDFKGLPNLERLDLEGCIGLVKLDPSIVFLPNLKFLNFRNCNNLVSVPNNLFGCSSLEILNLAGCSKLAECLDFEDVSILQVLAYYILLESALILLILVENRGLKRAKSPLQHKKVRKHKVP